MAMPNIIPYKSFCWSLGTTSFRTKNFNKTIEEQLALLDEFWTLEENKGQSWSGNKELQTRYYDFMQSKGFVEGNAGNKPKDAREKTSLFFFTVFCRPLHCRGLYLYGIICLI